MRSLEELKKLIDEKETEIKKMKDPKDWRRDFYGESIDWFIQQRENELQLLRRDYNYVNKITKTVRFSEYKNGKEFTIVRKIYLDGTVKEFSYEKENYLTNENSGNYYMKDILESFNEFKEGLGEW